MAFGRKKATATSNLSQDNVHTLATEALANRRAMRVRLATRITFDAPVLMHRWTQKAIVKMLSNMTGHDMPKDPKDLTEDFQQSWYRNVNGDPAIPGRILKSAIIEGAVSTQGLVSKAELRRELRVLGHTSPLRIKGKQSVKDLLEMDVRVAANQSGGPDLRSRAVAPAGAWADFVLDFPRTLSVDKVMAALTAAGDTIGLFDWRPERGGEWGTFTVEVLDNKHIDRIVDESRAFEDTYKIPDHLLRAFNAIPKEKLSDVARKVKSRIEQNGAQAHEPAE